MKKFKVAGIGLFVLLLSAILWQVHDVQSGSRKMLALLNGDASIDIVRFTTRHQQRRLECSDPDFLQYLKGAMMKHPPERIRVGDFTYEGTFEFNGGGRFVGTMFISTNGFDLTAVPNMDDIPTHSVPLPAPVPEKVRAVFDFFDEPWQKAAGTVLILEPGKPPRTQYDASLVAR
jgi:hypothetical protein